MSSNIILLFGGDSDERLVSVASAQNMARAVPSAKLWFWHKDGRIFAIDHRDISQHERPFTTPFEPKTNYIFNSLDHALSSDLCDNHLFLLGLHGGSGENGEVQKKLEQYSRPYTGSGSAASRVAFDKALSKSRLSALGGINMPTHLAIDSISAQAISSGIKDFYAQHGPLILKPACGGSSIGCSFVYEQSHIDRAAKDAFSNSCGLPKTFLAEKLISGREYTVGVIEDEFGLRALPCTEIRLEKTQAFDYDSKYLGCGSQEITPAELSPSMAQAAQHIAMKAHRGLDLYGYSRTDLILADDGFYYIETNTLPGLSARSLVPQQLAAAGVTMSDFISDQIKLGWTRTGSSNQSELRAINFTGFIL